MKQVFVIWQGMENISDSLLCSNGLVAEISGSFGRATIEVVGDVHVVFDGKDYFSPSEFPEELKEIIKGNWLDNPRVSVEESNWFEIFFRDCSDCIDVEGLNPVEIFSLMSDYINDVAGEKVLSQDFFEFARDNSYINYEDAQVYNDKKEAWIKENISPEIMEATRKRWEAYSKKTGIYAVEESDDDIVKEIAFSDYCTDIGYANGKRFLSPKEFTRREVNKLSIKMLGKIMRGEIK